MKIISFIICLMFCLLLLFTGMSIAGVTVSGGIAGGERVTPAGDGFVGTRSANVSTGGYNFSARYTFFSPVEATTSGSISWCYFRRYASNHDMTLVKPVLYDSSGNKITEATTCGWTNVSGNLYKIEVTEVSITSGTTYWLAIANADNDCQSAYSDVSGAIYRDETLVTGIAECPTTQATITNDETTSDSYIMPMWFSGDGNETD